MNYDIDFYAGKDLVYPATRPKKPMLKVGHTVDDILKYAEEVKEYEMAIGAYNAEVKEIKAEIASRQVQLRCQMATELGLTTDQLTIFWNKASEAYGSEGLRKICEEIFELADFYDDVSRTEKKNASNRILVLENALTWIAKNPSAHPSYIKKVANKALYPDV